jgi:hypothetical protein
VLAVTERGGIKVQEDTGLQRWVPYHHVGWAGDKAPVLMDEYDDEIVEITIARRERIVEQQRVRRDRNRREQRRLRELGCE